MVFWTTKNTKYKKELKKYYFKIINNYGYEKVFESKWMQSNRWIEKISIVNSFHRCTNCGQRVIIITKTNWLKSSPIECISQCVSQVLDLKTRFYVPYQSDIRKLNGNFEPIMLPFSTIGIYQHYFCHSILISCNITSIRLNYGRNKFKCKNSEVQV